MTTTPTAGPSASSASTTRTGPAVQSGRVMAIACLGAFLAFLDVTVVNVALPSISDSFGDASLSTLSWVLNAYGIVLAAFLVVLGRFTENVGRRLVFVVGIGVFTVASLLCGLAPSVEWLIGFRVLQGIGAALLVPASLALVVAAHPPERRSWAIGAWGAAAAVAAALGPSLGGLLVELGSWRWAFLVNVPIGIVAVLLARAQLTESRGAGRSGAPDLLGAGILAVALAVLCAGVVNGPTWGWLAWPTLACWGATLLLVVVFVRRSLRHRSPLLEPALLRIHSFNVGNLATLVAGFGFYAYLLSNALWLHYVWGYSMLSTGLALVPGAAVAALVAFGVAPVAARVGYRRFIVPGALVWAGAFAWYHQQVGVTPEFWSQWVPGQVLSGIGVGLTLPLLASAALTPVPGSRATTAASLISSSRHVGGVIGIAVLVVVLGEVGAGAVEDSFRAAWVMAGVTFVLVAAISLLLRHEEPPEEEVSDEIDHVFVVHAPAPPDSWAPPLPHAKVPTILGLPDAAQARLQEASTLIRVPGGTELITQGDPAGPAYALISGRLAVDVNGIEVREVGPGQVVGETALITGEARSATVRARRDSTLYEIPREAFDELTMSDPQASRAVLVQLAERLRTAGTQPSIRPPERPTVISVVGLVPGTSAAAVAESLVRRMSVHLTVAAPGRVDADGVERAEADADRVVLVADVGDDLEWRQFCVRQADAVVLLSHGDPGERPLGELPVPSRRPELVLQEESVPGDRLAAWQESLNPWQISVMAPSTSLDVATRPLADRLACRSLGVVFAGGGARGMSHVGVVQELEEAGLYIDRVAGTSMGAIMAACYAVGMSGAEVEQAAYEALVKQSLTDWRPSAVSLAKGDRSRASMNHVLGDDTRIEGLPRQLRMVSVDLTSRTKQVHDRGHLVEAALASGRLPVIFPAMPQDDGRLLIDGGVLDNLPVDTLVVRDEGPVVAISLDHGEEVHHEGRPPVPSLGENLMRTLTLSNAGIDERAPAHGAWLVSPPTLGVGLMEFHQLDLMVKAGRAAGRALLEASGGDFGRLGENRTRI